MLLNLPRYARFQWHPFSVCSGREDSTINFIVKNNGNFTRNLIYLFKEGWRDHNDESFTKISDSNNNKKKKLAIIEPEKKFSFVSASFRRFRATPNLQTYKINMSGPFGAPC